MNDKVVGKCGACGGEVTVPELWWGVNPPKPTCVRCGAVADTTARLPTLPMVPGSGGRRQNRRGTRATR